MTGTVELSAACSAKFALSATWRAGEFAPDSHTVEGRALEAAPTSGSDGGFVSMAVLAPDVAEAVEPGALDSFVGLLASTATRSNGDATRVAPVATAERNDPRTVGNVELSDDPEERATQVFCGDTSSNVEITRFASKVSTTGVREEHPWTSLIQSFRRPSVLSSKEDAGGWSPGVFRDNHRSADDVERLWAIGFDDDAVPFPSLEAAASFWGQFGAGFLHTTWSSRADKLRFRVVVKLSRTVTGDEYREIWLELRRRAAALGHDVGKEAKDPGRLWFVPCCPAERANDYRLAELTGDPLDADEILAEARRRDSETSGGCGEESRPAATQAPPHDRRYAQGALRGAADNVRSAPQGKRNDTLNKEAFGLGQLVSQGLLTQEEVHDTLREAALASGLSAQEVEDTLESGMGAGKRKPRQAATTSPAARAEPPPAPSAADEGMVRIDPPSMRRKRPQAHGDMFAGLVGELVKLYKEHTEGAPEAIAAQFLVGFGNQLGHEAYFRIGETVHYLNEFALVVGPTAKARKGDSWKVARMALEQADPAWRVSSGLSSAEGLIYHLRDSTTDEGGGGKSRQGSAGIDDKRLQIVETEFAGVLRQFHREGNTLSPLLRDVWDSKRELQTLTKNSPTKATGAHISIIGHSTMDDLRDNVTKTDIANGIMNRFLFVYAERGRLHPFGSRPAGDKTVEFVAAVRDAVARARTLGEMTFAPEAAERWVELYEQLSADRPGLVGNLLARAEAHVRRLAALYAAVDGSETIGLGHLESGLAFWRYSEASVLYLYGDLTGNDTADRIREGMGPGDTWTKTELRDHLGKVSAAQLNQAIDVLCRTGEFELYRRTETGGRPAECLRRVAKRGE